MHALEVLAAFCAGWLLAFGMNWIALLQFRRAETAHWTERARRLYPLRRSAALNILLIPAICGLIRTIFIREMDDLWIVELDWVAALVGAIAGTYPFDRKIFPKVSFSSWLRYVGGIWFLRFSMIGVVILGGIIMPGDFDWPLVAIGCAVIGFQLGLNFGIWIWLGRMCGLLKRADDSQPISAIVRQTASKMAIPYRAVWIFRIPRGYAAAFPTTRDLIFSEGLLNSHPEEEIAAICAHELAHLTESRRMVFARVIASTSLCPLIFVRPMVNAFDFSGIAILIIPFAISSVYIRHLARRMEVRADAIADKNAAEAGVYARALERLYQANQLPAVMRGNRQTHPHLYDRLLSAGVTPDYPRPKPPDTVYWTTGLIYLTLVILIILLVMK
jgi:Zn-dependent protease with chaperone function